MKKFICVLVFLAMVNVASAGMVDLWITSLDGAPIAPTKEITIKPSQVVDMALVFTGPGETLYALSADLVMSGQGGAEWQNIAGITKYADYSDPVFNQIILHDNKLGFSLAAGLANGPGDGVAFVQNILVHCTRDGDVLINLAFNPSLPGSDSIVLPSGEMPVLGNGVVIHQQSIPEPMTLTLLGLGGLFLARRKR